MEPPALAVKLAENAPASSAAASQKESFAPVRLAVSATCFALVTT
jgi:hypothetical protein